MARNGICRRLALPKGEKLRVSHAVTFWRWCGAGQKRDWNGTLIEENKTECLRCGPGARVRKLKKPPQWVPDNVAVDRSLLTMVVVR